MSGYALIEDLVEERSYETQRRILEGLSKAQRAWERETGSRLVRSSYPPYRFRYEGGSHSPEAAA